MRTKKIMNFRGRLSVVISVLLLSIQLSAVELTADSVVNDTTGVNLSEIVVEGASHRILSEGVSYAPSKDSKRLSIDATNLLENMGIPQLKVINGNVSTVEGNSVTIFIDYIKASEAELKGMRPKDVLRVEVLDYPQDVRFGNSEHVVNFIMRKYDWGGYTSFRLNGQLLNQEDVLGLIYQKFSYKKWMFDLSVGGQGVWNTRKEDYIQENIKDFVYEGISYPEIVRTSQTDMYKFNYNSEEAAFRATYRNEKMTVSHQLAFRRQSIPTETEESYIDFSPQLIPGSKATTYENFLINDYIIFGDYYFSMPKDNSIGFNWYIDYQKYRLYEDYTLGDTTPIVNGNRTTQYNPYININYSKKLGHDNSIGLYCASNNFIWDMRYEGTSGNHNKMLQSRTVMTVDYRHNLNFGLSLFLRAGTSYNLLRQNERNHTHQWVPYIHAAIGYRINAKNKLNLSGAWYSTLPFRDEASDVMQRQNELLWTTGNPDLKSSDNRWVMLQYTFMPLNNFSASAYVLYKNNTHSPVYQFSTAAGYDGVIRSLSDFNTFQTLQGGVTANLSLFRKTFSIYAYLLGKYESNDGLYHQHLYGLEGLAQAIWYHRNISLRLFYSLPSVRLENGMGYKVKAPHQYGIAFTYGVGNFSAQLQFNNWFTSHGQNMKTLDSPHYSYDGAIWNTNANRNLLLRLSYTFSYGRKVSRDNEISAQDGPMIN